MDKIFSTRLDESVVARIGLLSHRLRLPKKRIIENAINRYNDEQTGREKGDLLKEGFGAWNRSEKPAATVHKVRSAFQKAFTRHHA